MVPSGGDPTYWGRGHVVHEVRVVHGVQMQMTFHGRVVHGDDDGRDVRGHGHDRVHDDDRDDDVDRHVSILYDGVPPNAYQPCHQPFLHPGVQIPDWQPNPELLSTLAFRFPRTDDPESVQGPIQLRTCPAAIDPNALRICS